MSDEHYTCERNLKSIRGRIEAGEPYTADKYQTLKMIRSIERLRKGEKRRVAFENAAGKWFILKDAAGLQELEDLAHKHTEPERVDEEYLKRLSEMVQGLSDEQWERLKRSRGG